MGTQDINCVLLQTDGMDLFMLDITEGIPKEKEKRREEEGQKSEEERKSGSRPPGRQTPVCVLSPFATLEPVISVH